MPRNTHNSRGWRRNPHLNISPLSPELVPFVDLTEDEEEPAVQRHLPPQLQISETPLLSDGNAHVVQPTRRNVELEQRRVETLRAGALPSPSRRAHCAQRNNPRSAPQASNMPSSASFTPHHEYVYPSPEESVLRWELIDSIRRLDEEVATVQSNARNWINYIDEDRQFSSLRQDRSGGPEN